MSAKDVKFGPTPETRCLRGCETSLLMPYKVTTGPQRPPTFARQILWRTTHHQRRVSVAKRSNWKTSRKTWAHRWLRKCFPGPTTKRVTVTTTRTVLAQAIVKRRHEIGCRGMNPMDLKARIDLATLKVSSKAIKAAAALSNDSDEVAQVATISAKTGEKEIGPSDRRTRCRKSATKVLITVRKNKGLGNRNRCGVRHAVRRGYLSPLLRHTADKMDCPELGNASRSRGRRDKREDVSSLQQWFPLLEQVIQSQKTTADHLGRLKEKRWQTFGC